MNALKVKATPLSCMPRSKVPDGRCLVMRTGGCHWAMGAITLTEL